MSDSNQLFKYAVDYLSKYSSSKKNLERVLKNKIFKLKIDKKDKYKLYNSISEILDKLEKNKFIDDKIFASAKIRIFISIGKSKIYIKNYLLQKGVNSNVITECLEENDEKNKDWEINSAKIFARKKNLSKNIKDKEKNLAKMARAGFNYHISKKILDEI